MVYTSYFAFIRNLPKNIVTISICGKAPEFYKGIQYKKLAPSWDIFKQWKETKDNDLYTKRFKEERLKPLIAKNVMKELMELANNNDIALICYEKPLDFCHRHIVAEWLNENGFECKEFVKE